MDSNTVIDLAWLESATLNDLKAAMRNPAQLAAVNALLLTPEGKQIASDMLNDPDYKPKSQQQPTAEEAAQIEADRLLAEQQAAAAAAAEAEPVVVPAEIPTPVAPVIDYTAEDAEASKAGITVTRDAQGRITKLVKTYQAADEDGKPIGRPTHLEAKSWAELSVKQTDAHVNAVRYAERVKTNRFKQATAAIKTVEQSQVVKTAQAESAKMAEEAVNEKDPAKMQAAVQKSLQAERDAKIALDTARAHGAIIAEMWMDDHKEDFVPCVAASKILGDWLEANKLPLTYENLEEALKANRTQLPYPEKQVVVEEVPVSTASNTPVATSVAPAAAPVAPAAPIAPPAPAAAVSAAAPALPAAPSAPSQPVATAPSSTPVAAPIAQPATRRPGVNGGLQPGSLSAQRPSAEQIPQATKTVELKRAIAKMSPQEYRKKLKSPEFVAQLRAAGIPVVSQQTV
jgi:hypothetical protein